MIYTLLQVAFIGALPPERGDPRAPAHHNAPVLARGRSLPVAGLAGLGWLGHILRIDAFISPSGTGLIYTTGTSRISYGLARNRYAPQAFGRVSANGIPWVGLIFAFLFGLLFLLPFPSWRSIVGMIVGASVLMYAGAPLSVGAFRGQVPEANRPYRMPAACGARPGRVRRRRPAHLLVGLAGGMEARHRAGDRVRADRHLMAFDPQRPPLDWKSAVWLPVWLIGLGIVSWQGQYGGRRRATSTRCHRATPATSRSGGTC